MQTVETKMAIEIILIGDYSEQVQGWANQIEDLCKNQGLACVRMTPPREYIFCNKQERSEQWRLTARIIKSPKITYNTIYALVNSVRPCYFNKVRHTA